ncbi:hypothetical protein AMTRI_Chr05g59180 [Amborella trichopoda]
MDVLYWCIKEALRLQSPTMLILRTSHSDFTITTMDFSLCSCGMCFTLYFSYFICQILTHWVCCFRTHNSFDSDRFKPGRAEDKTTGAFLYIAFGAGSHRCLGESFAYL